jgi:hypothetical protein
MATTASARIPKKGAAGRKAHVRECGVTSSRCLTSLPTRLAIPAAQRLDTVALDLARRHLPVAADHARCDAALLDLAAHGGRREPQPGSSLRGGHNSASGQSRSCAASKATCAASSAFSAAR